MKRKNIQEIKNFSKLSCSPRLPKTADDGGSDLYWEQYVLSTLQSPLVPRCSQLLLLQGEKAC